MSKGTPFKLEMTILVSRILLLSVYLFSYKEAFVFRKHNGEDVTIWIII